MDQERLRPIIAKLFEIIPKIYFQTQRADDHWQLRKRKFNVINDRKYEIFI